MAAGSAKGREQSRQNRHQHGRASCLVPDFQSDLALEWLGNLAVVAVDGALAAMAGRLAAQLPGAAGALLAQAGSPGQPANLERAGR